MTPAGGAGLPASLEGLISPQELQRLATQGSQAVKDELARLSGRRLTQDTSLGGLLANVAGQPGYLVRTRGVVGVGHVQAAGAPPWGPGTVWLQTVGCA